MILFENYSANISAFEEKSLSKIGYNTLKTNLRPIVYQMFNIH